MRKVLSLFLSLFLSLNLLVPLVRAEDKTVNIYFFWSKTCPHCAKERSFLADFEAQNDWVEIKDFEVSKRENALFVQAIGSELNFSTSGVPFSIIGDQVVIGYGSDETTGKQIEALALKAYEEDWPDVIGQLNQKGEETTDQSWWQKLNNVKKSNGQTNQSVPDKVELPLIGDLEIRSVSLPLLTVVLGLADGFNPCAMWALLFLISLLLGMKDHKRMWLLGTVFILTSGLVYFLIMAAWLNVFLLIGLVSWVRIGIGLFALGAGGYNLKGWWQNRGGGCEVIEEEKKEKVFGRLKNMVYRPKLVLAILGIIVLAVTVNLVELLCSAGLPAVYTSVLVINQLPLWQYYLYILAYVFFFMLDDLLVFVIAMSTLRAVGIESKYGRWSRFIGGILMVLIGLAMLFKPEWLAFG